MTSTPLRIGSRTHPPLLLRVSRSRYGAGRRCGPGARRVGWPGGSFPVFAAGALAAARRGRLHRFALHGSMDPARGRNGLARLRQLRPGHPRQRSVAARRLLGRIVPVLLAGLMHLIEQGSTAELLSGVTVATVDRGAGPLGARIRAVRTHDLDARTSALCSSSGARRQQPATRSTEGRGRHGDRLAQAGSGRADGRPTAIYRGPDRRLHGPRMLARVRATGGR